MMIKLDASRDELIESNIGLVHSFANKFRGRGVEYDDLFQAGCVGLIKAVDGFDPSRGNLFSTYAVPVILGEIKRIFRDGGSVKVGRSIKEKARKLLIMKEELTKTLGQEPTISELSEYANIDICEAVELLTAAMPTISLTSYCEDENENKQLDIPTDSPHEYVSDLIALREVMESLDEDDRKLIELRYFKGMTQSNAAKQLGMSQVQVSRKEKQILIKLRYKLIE